MRNWKVTGKYPQYNGAGAVASTHVIIAAEDGAVIPQLIKQDLTSTNDTEIIKAALEEFEKSEYVEIAMGEAVQKVDDLEKVSQEAAKTAKTAQAAAGLAKVSAERTQKMINLQTIHVLTSGGRVEPDIYKGMLELIEPVKKGEYQAYDVFTVVDDKHEDQAGKVI
ncbi:hypothetical protein STRIC_0375 [Streptococcus ictaluri 707-05]|uniref:Phage protein n=1 Tax=Streptococcus ictaluri 707-05 TaxID=764299 RepID=G5K5N9_9STRE|nr:hypothetical protein STRIC_0375 [Streptococcus ictaluri 707-05]